MPSEGYYSGVAERCAALIEKYGPGLMRAGGGGLSEKSGQRKNPKPPTRTGYFNWTPEAIETLIEGARSGLQYSVIAAKIGVSPGTVVKKLQALGEWTPRGGTKGNKDAA
jgi:hypothetical protein